MYDQMPTASQWAKDTAGDKTTKRNDEALALFDDAVSKWEKYKADKKSNWDTELLLLSGIRHQALYYNDEKASNQTKESVLALGGVATRMLMDMFSVKTDRHLGSLIRNACSTGMSQGGKDTDKKVSAKYIQKSDINTLSKYEVFCENGRLLQYNWQSTDWKTIKSLVCTITKEDIIEEVDRKISIDDGGFNLWKDKFVNNFNYQTMAYPYEAIIDGFVSPDTEMYIRAYPETNNNLVIMTQVPNGNGGIIKVPYKNFESRCRQLKLQIGLGQEKFTDEQQRSYYKVDIPREFFKECMSIWEVPKRKKSINWTSCYGTVCGSHWAGYVLGTNGKLYMSFQDAGNLIYHSYYFAGKPVLCAGSILVDGNGILRGISNRSGHYQPSSSSLLFVLRYFKEKGIDLSNVIVVIGKDEYKHNGQVAKQIAFREYYNAKEFLNANGSPRKKGLTKDDVEKMFEKIEIFPDTQTDKRPISSLCRDDRNLARNLLDIT